MLRLMLAPIVRSAAEDKKRTEDQVRKDLLFGSTIGDTYERFGVM